MKKQTIGFCFSSSCGDNYYIIADSYFEAEHRMIYHHAGVEYNSCSVIRIQH